MAFCTNCGSQIPETSRFCSICGAPAASAAPEGAPSPASPDPSAGPTWSAAAGSPAVTGYLAKQRTHAVVFATIFYTLVLLAGFLAPTLIKDPAVADLPTSLAVAAFVILFSLALTARAASKKNAAWDGVLESKRIRVKRDHDEHGPSHTHRYHELRFRASTGKRYKIDVNPSAYETFQAGEPVRKHRGFLLPERLHKYPGTTMCLSCGRLNETSQSKCGSCRAPLFH